MAKGEGRGQSGGRSGYSVLMVPRGAVCGWTACGSFSWDTFLVFAKLWVLLERGAEPLDASR